MDGGEQGHPGLEFPFSAVKRVDVSAAMSVEEQGRKRKGRMKYDCCVMIQRDGRASRLLPRSGDFPVGEK